MLRLPLPFSPRGRPRNEVLGRYFPITRANSRTEGWARAKTGGHAYRRGTVLVLARRDDLGVEAGALVGQCWNV